MRRTVPDLAVGGSCPDRVDRCRERDLPRVRGRPTLDRSTAGVVGPRRSGHRMSRCCAGRRPTSSRLSRLPASAALTPPRGSMLHPHANLNGVVVMRPKLPRGRGTDHVRVKAAHSERDGAIAGREIGLEYQTDRSRFRKPVLGLECPLIHCRRRYPAVGCGAAGGGRRHHRGRPPNG
jgi:hypothetical protein